MKILGKYLWLVETLRGGGVRGLTFDQIRRRHLSAFGEDYPRRTFNHHREGIADVFGLEICCNRSTNCYFIPYADEALDRDRAKEWLVDTFTVSNLLSDSRSRLSGRVSVEQIPSGHRHLPVILSAMRENRMLEFSYGKYSGEQAERRHLAPYAVKEFEKRWYVVGYSQERSALRVYGLDRIGDIAVSDQTFRLPEGFDVDTLFYDSFGVYLPDDGQKAVTVELKTSEREARFLRDLPLHHSQKEVESGLFRLRIIPNPDFVMALCRLGDRVEVLSPEGLRRQVALALRRGAAKYSDIQET